MIKEIRDPWIVLASASLQPYDPKEPMVAFSEWAWVCRSEEEALKLLNHDMAEFYGEEEDWAENVWVFHQGRWYQPAVPKRPTVSLKEV